MLPLWGAWYCTALLFCGCYCHLEPDAFVHSVRPRKDVIVLQWYNALLWYFAKEAERSDVRCHSLGMPMNTSMWDTFPRHTWPLMSICSLGKHNRNCVWQANWKINASTSHKTLIGMEQGAMRRAGAGACSSRCRFYLGSINLSTSHTLALVTAHMNVVICTHPL